MKFLKSKAILAGGVLVSVLAGAIFVSCHSMAMVSQMDDNNALALTIAQSLDKPCCMTQDRSYALHPLRLSIIAPTISSQLNIGRVVMNPIWLQVKMIESLRGELGDGSGNAIELPQYNYLKNFIAQGLLQPRLYDFSQASV